MSDHIIEVKNLTKRYKNSKELAVNDVSFYVESGSFFSLLGPNGAGKTTTISILTTLLSKTAGEVSISGIEVAKNPSQVRQLIGVIFQNPSLDRNLTAEENVRFHVNLYGLFPYRPTFLLMPKPYKKRITSLAKVLDLEKDIHKPVKSLSGGMKRKLEIIRSLMHNPKILFLDEPTTGLDPISRANLWNYLQKVRSQENITIFLTTHYLEEAENSDYLCIINHGQVVSKGTPEDIKQDLIEKHILVDAEQRKKLIAEIKFHKYSFEGQGPFKIFPNGKSSQKIIHSIKTPLSRLQIENPTLEEAYVKVISQS